MKLLSWGANGQGQLGHGASSDQCFTPFEVIAYDKLLVPECVTSIVGGAGHTVILDNKGQIFACGWNHKGQLALPRNSECFTFKLVDSLEGQLITQISCGWDSTFAVTNNGQLLAWGSNSYGQLGHLNTNVSHSEVPIELPLPSIRQVSCGLRHTAMTTTDGRVLVCGNGRKCQLGLIDASGYPIQELRQPQEVPGLTSVVSVACGQNSTFAQTASGKIYAWGDNKYGQLSLDPTIQPIIATPFEIEPVPKETLGCDFKVLSGWTHAAILTENGQIINWGRNNYSQLGCPKYGRQIPWKKQTLEMGRVKQLALGSEHNIAITDTGQVMSWGWNEHGNCGMEAEEDIRQPTQIAFGKKAIVVGTGAGHSFAVVEEVVQS